MPLPERTLKSARLNSSQKKTSNNILIMDNTHLLLNSVSCPTPAVVDLSLCKAILEGDLSMLRTSKLLDLNTGGGRVNNVSLVKMLLENELVGSLYSNCRLFEMGLVGVAAND